MAKKLFHDTLKRKLLLTYQHALWAHNSPNARIPTEACHLNIMSFGRVYEIFRPLFTTALD